MEHTTIAVDLAKSVFQVAVSHRVGHIDEERRLSLTDRTDAKGLLEANRNDAIHTVPVKTIEHQAIASLRRLRCTWLATRTARLNTLRGLLRGFGIFIPVGAQHVVPRVRALLLDQRVAVAAHDARRCV